MVAGLPKTQQKLQDVSIVLQDGAPQYEVIELVFGLRP